MTNCSVRAVHCITLYSVVRVPSLFSLFFSSFFFLFFFFLESNEIDTDSRETSMEAYRCARGYLLEIKAIDAAVYKE